ncbi:hypothetical protein CSPAE12_08629, partial [Colletotrichum incanum]
SLALFAFWLRSSVVSVLFSLISERSLRRPIVIIPIFGLREKSSVLAHDSSHSVPGITLPPGDANIFFHYVLWLVQGHGEEIHDSDFVRVARHGDIGARLKPECCFTHRPYTPQTGSAEHVAPLPVN